jgi:hypothetical protein
MLEVKNMVVIKESLVTIAFGALIMKIYKNKFISFMIFVSVHLSTFSLITQKSLRRFYNI